MSVTVSGSESEWVTVTIRSILHTGRQCARGCNGSQCKTHCHSTICTTSRQTNHAVTACVDRTQVLVLYLGLLPCLPCLLSVSIRLSNYPSFVLLIVYYYQWIIQWRMGSAKGVFTGVSLLNQWGVLSVKAGTCTNFQPIRMTCYSI